MNVRTWSVCAITAVTLAAGASAGCDEKLSDIAGPSPNLTPTFSSIQQEILQSTDEAGRTACVQCHTGRIPNLALNFTSGQDIYAQLVNVPSRQKPELMLVNPGNPDASYLIHKLEGGPGIVGVQMPRNGPPFLTAGQLQVIRRWIEIGAPR